VTKPSEYLLESCEKDGKHPNWIPLGQPNLWRSLVTTDKPSLYSRIQVVNPWIGFCAKADMDAAAKAAQAEARAKAKMRQKKDAVQSNSTKPKDEAKAAEPAKPAVPKTASLFDMPTPEPSPATPAVVPTSDSTGKKIFLMRSGMAIPTVLKTNSTKLLEVLASSSRESLGGRASYPHLQGDDRVLFRYRWQVTMWSIGASSPHPSMQKTTPDQLG
jgi:hypothetical protein